MRAPPRPLIILTTLLSIIICTRNRAASLRRTLAALATVRIPAGASAEIVVVDNGSTDDTAAAVREAAAGSVPLRYVSEPQPGQSRARNRGLAEARGEIIVFTDDDIIPAADWLERLCAPILNEQAEVAAGCVHMAPDLLQPWMTAAHCAWLADTGTLNLQEPGRLVGANMAFSKSVLAKVPAFDLELGPGALGFGDDTLFSQQLKAAGYKIAPAFDAVVEHHFAKDRLDPKQWFAAARKLGQVDAYISYHWENFKWPHPRTALCLAFLHWAHCRFLTTLLAEGFPAPEDLLNATRNLHARLQYLREQKRPRNYEPRGLVKRTDGAPPRENPGSIRLTKPQAES